MSSTTPNPPNNPPPSSISTAIKQAFRCSCVIVSRLLPRPPPNILITYIPTTLMNSIIATVRYLFPHQWGPQEVPNLLPQSINDIAQQQRYQPRNSTNLAKLTLSLSFQAVLSFQSNSSAGQAQDLKYLYAVAMVTAFAASFIDIRLRDTYPRIAGIAEKVGSFCVATGTFLSTAIFLPGKLTWIIWLLGSLSLLAFSTP